MFAIQWIELSSSAAAQRKCETWLRNKATYNNRRIAFVNNCVNTRSSQCDTLQPVADSATVGFTAVLTGCFAVTTPWCKAFLDKVIKKLSSVCLWKSEVSLQDSQDTASGLCYERSRTRGSATGGLALGAIVKWGANTFFINLVLC
jgi:hypothetical protein